MKKRLAISSQRLEGWLFIVGEQLCLRVNCEHCGEPLISIRSRILGTCPACMKRAGIEMGRILIVDPPSSNVKWN